MSPMCVSMSLFPSSFNVVSPIVKRSVFCNLVTFFIVKCMFVLCLFIYVWMSFFVAICSYVLSCLVFKMCSRKNTLSYIYILLLYLHLFMCYTSCECLVFLCLLTFCCMCDLKKNISLLVHLCIHECINWNDILIFFPQFFFLSTFKCSF